jgi:exodeoxyribonuclease V alpha subunit
MEHPHQVVGRVKRVLFSSEEEAHSIVLVAVKEKNLELKEAELVITGTGVGIELGGTYQAFGRLVDHPRFGKQLKAELIRRSVPMTKHATIRFLTNGSFSGIGPKTAKNIVDALGEDAVDLILKDERVLNQVPGSKQKQADIILNRLAMLYGVDQLMLFLAPFDVTPKLAAKIYAAYEGDAMARIREDPSSLMYEVNGIGFKTADHIAAHLGLVGFHPERVAASIMHILEQEAGEGHAFATVDSLLQRAPRLLGEDPGERLDQAIELLPAEDKVKLEEGCLYLPTIFYAEVRAANELARVMANGAEQEVDVATILEAIGHLEAQFGMEYAAQQREAIELAFKAPLMAWTGGPGTGKTTVIKGILHALQEIHDWPLEKSRVKTGDVYPYVLVAPKGRAAKRLSEATDVPAITIHCLLKYDGTNFQLNQDQPITGEVRIIVESSMIDIYLLSSLLLAVPNGMKSLFVGDRDHLPSVGPAQVLADLMHTEGIPVVRLNVVHRQAEDSSILRLAHELMNRTTSADLLSPLAERRFYTATPQETLRGISAFVVKALAKGYSKFNVQVLAPTYRGQVGIDELNVALQRVYNPKAPK